MFGDDRRALRARFLDVWHKARARSPLEPLEAMIADVLALHPEYDRLFEQGDALLDDDWTPEHGESNPFLHLGLHIAIREQVATDRPPGVRTVHGRLAARLGALEAEHRMIECLASALWAAGRTGGAPDEAAYVECLRGLK